MRIDAALIPPSTGCGQAPAPAAHTSFGALLSASSAEAAESKTAAETGARAALPANVYSFDALGTLGLGGPVGPGARMRAAGKHPAPGDSGDGNAGHDPRAPLPEAQPASPSAMTAPPAAPASLPMAVPTSAATPKSGSVSHVAPGLSASWGRAVPLPTGTQAPPATVPPATSRVVANVRAVTVEPPQEAPPARKAAPALRFQAEIEPAFDGMSVVLSETDGTLAIVASAPGLAESERQTLQRVADETAGEAGIPLGELRLNGVPVRPFSKVS